MAKRTGSLFRDSIRSQKRKKTRQGQGRGSKFSTRIGSKRFKKKYRGQGRK